MSFPATVPEQEATGRVAEIYRQLCDSLGYVPNYGKTFSLRPARYEAWVQLNTTIKRSKDPRHYELATVAAVRRRSSYCTLAHSDRLLGLGSTADELEALATGTEELDEGEEAIV